MSRAGNLVKCARCRHEHLEGQRVEKPRKTSGTIQIADTCCPRCGGMSFYDLRPQVAWCWASGLIEFGDELPANSPEGGGAIEIARGPMAYLRPQITVLARHGQGASAGCLLVPGVPEANSQRAKGDALAEWLKWCGSRRPRDGVTWSTLREADEVITDPAVIEATFAADYEAEEAPCRS